MRHTDRAGLLTCWEEQSHRGDCYINDGSKRQLPFLCSLVGTNKVTFSTLSDLTSTLSGTTPVLAYLQSHTDR